MKWNVMYNCGFDENDGDFCEESGIMQHPFTREAWIVDNSDKEEMKLLAIIKHYLFEREGDDDDDEDHDFWDVDNDAIIAKLEQESLLQDMGVTAEEIKDAIDKFDMHSYFPTPREMLCEPHGHWFYLTILPADVEEREIDDDFLLKPWKTETIEVDL